MNHSRPARLQWTRRVGPGIFHQRFLEPHIARHARAGQFVHLLPGAKHLFRRAFSVYARDPAEGTFDILHQVFGEGTRCLSQVKSGETVDALGPLGNRFPKPESGRRAILVGGGLGMAPLRHFAAELHHTRKGPKGRRIENDRLPLLLLGARSRSLSVAPWGLAGLGLRPVWASDDGSRGFHGNVVALLDDQISRRRLDPERSVIYGCGPEPMMAALAQLCARHRAPCYVSLERSMPCGYGVCMGCVVKSRGRDGYETYRRVCKDGPVFDAGQILF